MTDDMPERIWAGQYGIWGKTEQQVPHEKGAYYVIENTDRPTNNEGLEALRRFDDIIQKSDREKYLLSEINRLEGERDEMMNQALSKPQEVDVEAIKKELFPDIPRSYEQAQCCATIDLLYAKSYLNTPDPDTLVIKKSELEGIYVEYDGSSPHMAAKTAVDDFKRRLIKKAGG